MFVLGDAVGFDFFFISQAQAVFAAVLTVEVPVVPSPVLRAAGGLAPSWTCCLVRWYSGPYTKARVRSELVLLAAAVVAQSTTLGGGATWL
jgi:hypothetical protein